MNIISNHWYTWDGNIFPKIIKILRPKIWEDSVIINACFQIVTTEISTCGKLRLNEVSFPHMQYDFFRLFSTNNFTVPEHQRPYYRDQDSLETFWRAVVKLFLNLFS